MTLTDILTAHRAIPMTGTHSGWFWCRECHEYFTTLAAHAVHVVEEMAAANIVAIELPELPEPSRVIRHENGDAFPVWGDPGFEVILEGIPDVELSMFEGGYLLSKDGGAALAAALLAASAAAAVRPTPTPGETP